ncbi:hypothetical protein HYH02_008327 [Chlamydomonas schloesseri]|uniref:Uncharacterized protein n=1 Tax=Chlamydomonas schloesseri TaxID=2026947 RepID=A0A836B3N7_9CHLO|nr:hypothetical protein HYH02_008327 [Chlamydomonas schloesseri]|eukprot:KAG2446766.1 hypothetical protein HYH02_008327 [Chlamydomonas schloesseri]
MSSYKAFRLPESSLSKIGASDAGGTSSSSASAPAPLSLVPEKAAMGHQIRSIVPAQFWGASVASASSPDGALASAVCDPAPLPLLAGAGLSRPHLVLATQALKLPGRPSLVGMPSVCQGQGGLVVDRVLAHSGGDGWWAVLSGRAKLGRMVSQRGDVAAALTEPSNYSLCANSRVQLRRNTIVRTRVDWLPPPSTGGLIRRRGAAPRAAAAPLAHAGGAAGSAPPPLSLSSELRARLGPRAEVRADLAIAQRVSVAHDAAAPAATGGALDAALGAAGGAAGGGGAAATTTPLLLGLQAGTPASSRAPVVWRVGALQVTAPSTVPLAGVDAGAAAGPGSRQAPGLQSAVYVQGTAALQGERFLWRAPKAAPRRRADAAAAGEAGAGGGAAGDGSGADDERPPLPPPSLGPHNPVRQAATYMLTRMGRSDAEDGGSSGRRRGSGGGAASGAAGGKAAAGGAAAAAGGASGASGARGGSEAPFGVELPAASSVQEALMDATQSISRLRDDVTQATQWVSGGGLVEQLEKAHVATGAAGGGTGAAAKKPPRHPHRHHHHHRHKSGAAADATDPVPWSAFVGEPHIKVAGVAGLTLRAPIIRMTHGTSVVNATATAAASEAVAAQPAATAAAGVGDGGGELQPSPLSGALPVRLDWVQDLGLRRFLTRGGRSHREGAEEAALLDAEEEEAGAAGAAGRGSGSGRRGAVGALRPFASAAAAVQLGRFSRWVADFTRVTAQLDAGLWAPPVKGSSDDQRPAPGGPPCQRHPAFALSDTGAWHCLSLSLSQQLLGPLRLAADWRYELASHRPLAMPALWGSPVGAGATGAVEAEEPGARAGAAAAAAAGGRLAHAAKWVPGAARGVAGHVAGMRPQLLESVYALDLALPGSHGAARLVAWWAPRRREGMLELRLF